MGCLGLSINKNRNHPRQIKVKRSSTVVEQYCRRFSFKEIQKATNDFATKLSQEAFNTTYYEGQINVDGVPANCYSQVSIKRLKSAEMFKNEVELLCQLRHPQLVSFIGFCDDRYEKFLVYEYMPNGTLHDRLHKTDIRNYQPLPWKKRLEICIGAARGLHYLHTGNKYTIFHRDVKSNNIMLDDKWVAKISNFSLTKRGPFCMFKGADPQLENIVMAAQPYIDPEYALTGKLTDKTDVFSFGVVLLEVVSGKESWYWQLIDHHPPYSPSDVIRKAGTEIIEPFIRGEISEACWIKFIQIAQRCLQEKGADRPAIGEVEVELELALQLQNTADQACSSQVAGSQQFH